MAPKSSIDSWGVKPKVKAPLNRVFVSPAGSRNPDERKNCPCSPKRRWPTGPTSAVETWYRPIGPISVGRNESGSALAAAPDPARRGGAAVASRLAGGGRRVGGERRRGRRRRRCGSRGAARGPAAGGGGAGWAVGGGVGAGGGGAGRPAERRGRRLVVGRRPDRRPVRRTRRAPAASTPTLTRGRKLEKRIVQDTTRGRRFVKMPVARARRRS